MLPSKGPVGKKGEGEPSMGGPLPREAHRRGVSTDLGGSTLLGAVARGPFAVPVYLAGGITPCCVYCGRNYPVCCRGHAHGTKSTPAVERTQHGLRLAAAIWKDDRAHPISVLIRQPAWTSSSVPQRMCSNTMPAVVHRRCLHRLRIVLCARALDSWEF